MVTYRPVEARDVPSLAALVARCDAASPWLEVVPPQEQEEADLWDDIVRPGQWMLLAEADGDPEPVGFVQLRPADDPGHGHVSDLFVDPRYWGRGLGRVLLAAAVEEMRARGYARAGLRTHASNQRARRLYEAAGWRDTGDRHLNKVGERMVRYEIDLGRP